MSGKINRFSDNNSDGLRQCHLSKRCGDTNFNTPISPSHIHAIPDDDDDVVYVGTTTTQTAQKGHDNKTDDVVYIGTSIPEKNPDDVIYVGTTNTSVQSSQKRKADDNLSLATSRKKSRSDNNASQESSHHLRYTKHRRENKLDQSSNYKKRKKLRDHEDRSRKYTTPPRSVSPASAFVPSRTPELDITVSEKNPNPEDPPPKRFKSSFVELKQPSRNSTTKLLSSAETPESTYNHKEYQNQTNKTGSKPYKSSRFNKDPMGYLHLPSSRFDLPDNDSSNTESRVTQDKSSNADKNRVLRRCSLSEKTDDNVDATKEEHNFHRNSTHYSGPCKLTDNKKAAKNSSSGQNTNVIKNVIDNNAESGLKATSDVTAIFEKNIVPNMQGENYQNSSSISSLGKYDSISGVKITSQHNFNQVAATKKITKKSKSNNAFKSSNFNGLNKSFVFKITAQSTDNQQINSEIKSSPINSANKCINEKSSTNANNKNVIFPPLNNTTVDTGSDKKILSANNSNQLLSSSAYSSNRCIEDSCLPNASQTIGAVDHTESIIDYRNGSNLLSQPGLANSASIYTKTQDSFKKMSPPQLYNSARREINTNTLSINVTCPQNENLNSSNMALVNSGKAHNATYNNNSERNVCHEPTNHRYPSNDSYNGQKYNENVQNSEGTSSTSNRFNETSSYLTASHINGNPGYTGHNDYEISSTHTTKFKENFGNSGQPQCHNKQNIYGSQGNGNSINTFRNNNDFQQSAPQFVHRTNTKPQLSNNQPNLYKPTNNTNIDHQAKMANYSNTYSQNNKNAAFQKCSFQSAPQNPYQNNSNRATENLSHTTHYDNTQNNRYPVGNTDFRFHQNSWNTENNSVPKRNNQMDNRANLENCHQYNDDITFQNNTQQKENTDFSTSTGFQQNAGNTSQSGLFRPPFREAGVENCHPQNPHFRHYPPPGYNINPQNGNSGSSEFEGSAYNNLHARNENTPNQDYKNIQFGMKRRWSSMSSNNNREIDKFFAKSGTPFVPPLTQDPNFYKINPAPPVPDLTKPPPPLPPNFWNATTNMTRSTNNPQPELRDHQQNRFGNVSNFRGNPNNGPSPLQGHLKNYNRQQKMHSYGPRPFKGNFERPGANMSKNPAKMLKLRTAYTTTDRFIKRNPSFIGKKINNGKPNARLGIEKNKRYGKQGKQFSKHLKKVKGKFAKKPVKKPKEKKIKKLKKKTGESQDEHIDVNRQIFGDFAPIKVGLKKPAKGHLKANTELYWKEWWNLYGYVEKHISPIDRNDVDVMTALNFPTSVKDAALRKIKRQLLVTGVTKMLRHIKLNESDYAMRDIYSVLKYKHKLQDPNFQQHLNAKERDRVEKVLKQVCKKTRRAFFCQNMICRWHFSSLLLKRAETGEVNLKCGHARKLMNDKAFIYLVYESIQELKKLISDDWPEFEEFYNSL